MVSRKNFTYPYIKMTKKIITSLGLDTSLTGTGIVLLTDRKITKQRLIKSKPVGDKPVHELVRIRTIVEEIEMIVSENLPTIAVIEGMAYMAKNTTALVQLSALNYMTRALLFDYNIPFVIVAPTTLKKFITGKGNAKKDIMLIETYKRYGITILDDNENDAHGLARIGELLLSKNTNKLPIFQKEVLELLAKQL